MQLIGGSPKGATAIVQGFGNLRSVAAGTLAEPELTILGVSDHTACYFDPKGLPVDALLAYATRHGVLRGFSNQLAFDPADLMAQKCDVLVPAALERVIDAPLAARLQCRVWRKGPTAAPHRRRMRC